jgi:hypothetical protein
LSPWLFVLGTILFLLEILERRTGWFSRTRAPVEPEKVKKPEPKAAAPAAVIGKANAPAPVASVQPKAEAAKAAGADSTLDALGKARARAHRRMGADR